MANYLAFQHNIEPDNAGATFYNDVRSGDVGVAIFDENQAATGHTVSITGGTGFSLGALSGLTTSGDAIWVNDDAAIYNCIAASTETFDLAIDIDNLNDAETIFFELFTSYPSGDRGVYVRVNGGTEVFVPNSTGGVPNSTTTALFTGISPSSGNVRVEVRNDGGNGYINVARYDVETNEPAITIDQAELTPGAAVSGDGSNFQGAPADQSNISLGTATIPVTITNVTGSAGSIGFDHSSTMPDRPPANGIGVQRQQYGNINVNLPDPGA